jgi:hypothetical protein
MKLVTRAGEPSEPHAFKAAANLEVSKTRQKRVTHNFTNQDKPGAPIAKRVGCAGVAGTGDPMEGKM